jgi:peptidoglycan-N-acetylglucosamine deacetylase
MTLLGLAAGAAATAHAGPALSQPFPGLGRRLGVESAVPGAGTVALTFDDGPHPQGTPAVLAALADAQAVATFFLVGEQVARDPGLAREIVAAGHAVGVHGDRHRGLLALGPEETRAELDRGHDRVAAAVGFPVDRYRPAFGVLSGAALAHARRRGWRTLLWTQWGRDWERRASAGSIAARCTRRLGGGSVVLLHDADHYATPGSWRATAAALPRILERAAELGLRTVTA